MYAEGTVYPNAMSCVCDPFPIDKNMKRFIAFDYGLSDDAVYVFAAVDEVKSCVYVYKEVRCHDRNIEELARIYHEETKDIPSGGLVTSPIIDPKSGPKRDYEKKTLAEHFLVLNNPKVMFPGTEDLKRTVHFQQKAELLPEKQNLLLLRQVLLHFEKFLSGLMSAALPDFVPEQNQNPCFAL